MAKLTKNERKEVRKLLNQYAESLPVIPEFKVVDKKVVFVTHTRVIRGISLNKIDNQNRRPDTRYGIPDEYSKAIHIKALEKAYEKDGTHGLSEYAKLCKVVFTEWLRFLELTPSVLTTIPIDILPSSLIKLRNEYIIKENAKRNATK